MSQFNSNIFPTKGEFNYLKAGQQNL